MQLGNNHILKPVARPVICPEQTKMMSLLSRPEVQKSNNAQMLILQLYLDQLKEKSILARNNQEATFCNEGELPIDYEYNKLRSQLEQQEKLKRSRDDKTQQVSSVIPNVEGEQKTTLTSMVPLLGGGGTKIIINLRETNREIEDSEMSYQSFEESLSLESTFSESPDLQTNLSQINDQSGQDQYIWV